MPILSLINKLESVRQTLKASESELKSEIQNIIKKIATAIDDLKEIRSYSDMVDSKLEKKLEFTEFENTVEEFKLEHEKLWEQINKYRSLEDIGKHS